MGSDECPDTEILSQNEPSQHGKIAFPSRGCPKRKSFPLRPEIADKIVSWCHGVERSGGLSLRIPTVKEICDGSKQRSG